MSLISAWGSHSGGRQRVREGRPVRDVAGCRATGAFVAALGAIGTVCFGETRKVSWQSTISVSGARYSVPHTLIDKRV